MTYICPTKFSDVGFGPTKFKLCPTKIKSDRTNVLSSQIFICSPEMGLFFIVLHPIPNGGEILFRRATLFDSYLVIFLYHDRKKYLNQLQTLINNSYRLIGKSCQQ
jgi:hypothetical protein